MHVPEQFAERREHVLRALIAVRPFATLVASTARGLEANQLPLLLDDSQPGRLRLQGHVAKANPIWRDSSDGSEVLAIFQGPQHYVSPSWYPSKREHGKAVPTWNYVVVHARGTIHWTQDAAWLRSFLERLTSAHEAARPEPWHVDDAPAEYVARNLEAIVGLEIEVRELVGKWKLNQNKSAADRAGVIAGLSAEQNDDAAALARAMREREESS